MFMETAWTLSSLAAGSGRCYTSAVLHAEYRWGTPADPAQADGARAVPNISARVLAADRVRDVPLPEGCTVRLTPGSHPAWAHVHIALPDGAPLLRATFQNGRLVYATGELLQRAGLAGGTYDQPTGMLEAHGEA